MTINTILLLNRQVLTSINQSVFLFLIVLNLLTTIAHCQEPINSKEQQFAPNWSKKIVWYQIVPERFRNGDALNDPKITDIIGADPLENPKYWKVHPWGSDWYELQEYEKMNANTGIQNHLMRRRYGGDLQGIIDQLDYLEDLGIGGIYLTPVFFSPSLHKYDAVNYHHIDPNFGPDPDGDRKMMAQEDPTNPDTWLWTSADELALELIEKAHQKNIKIIFDGVFNHMGYNNFALQDIRDKQNKSKYKNWFNITSWQNTESGTNLEYDSWFGVKTLPEIKEDSSGIVSGPKNYIFQITERWMNPKNMGVSKGIDGWRLDVATSVHQYFWRDWRKLVKKINPEAYITAELFKSPEEAKPYLQGDQFDGEMNYNFAITCAEFFFKPDSLRLSVTNFDNRLKYLRSAYPKDVIYASMNLFGSHDTNRLASHIVNRNLQNYAHWGEYFVKSNAITNPEYSERKPKDEDIALQKLFLTFQMTFVGAPMIYYGDEVGMWGGTDPSNRKPMVWEDIDYDNEIYGPTGQMHDPDKVEVNNELFQFYKKLISIRNKYLCLQIGEIKTLLTDDEHGVYMYSRQLGNKEIVVILNTGQKEFVFNPKKMNITQDYHSLIEDKMIKFNKSYVIPIKSGAIIRINP